MRLWKIILVLVIIGGAAVAYASLQDPTDDYKIDHATAQRGPLTFSIETLGQVSPLTEVVVSCETTGKIVEILVDYDEEVRKDQVICRIDPEIVQTQHKQSMASLARAESALADARIARDEQLALLPQLTKQAKAELDAAEASLAQAQFNFDRIDKLFKQQQSPEAEWVGAKTAVATSQAAVETARANVVRAENNERFGPPRLEEAIKQAAAARDLAKAQFDTTEVQVERCIIRSPIDGVILRRYLDVGTTVNPTLQPPPLFLIAPSLSRMQVSARVSESDIAHIEVGQPASFAVEGKRRSEFRGSILEKRNQPDIIQGVTTYTVILEVENDARRTLLPGMSVNVVIECVKRDETLKIENKALRFRPPLSRDERREKLEAVEWPDEPKKSDGTRVDYCQKAHLWSFNEADKTWTPVPIWTGITDNLETEILLGAESGDKFVSDFDELSSKGFSLKEALKLASPDNRTL